MIGSARGRHVAVMGLSGSGKSTLANRLVEESADVDRRVAVVHHSSTKLSVLRRWKERYRSQLIDVLKRRGVHTDWSQSGSETGGTGGGTLLSWFLSTSVVLTSFVKAVWYRLRHWNAFLILDRCFLDDVVKSRWRLGSRAKLPKLLIRLVPKPDLVIVLDGDPEITYGRMKKKTCSFDEYLGKRRIFEQVLAEAGERGWEIRRVDVDERSVADVHRRVSELIGEERLMADSPFV